MGEVIGTAFLYSAVVIAFYVIVCKVIPIVLWERYYKKQGIKFANGIAFFTDLFEFTKCAIANPHSMPLYATAKNIHGEKLPPVWCMHLFSTKAIIINAPEYLEDVYVKLNSLHTKHIEEKHVFNILMPTSIVFKYSEDKDYAERRKILASAFYKNNVAKMINLIKNVTRKLVEETQAKGNHELDIIDFTSILQQRIIINISVGPGFSDRLMDFENWDGTVQKRPIYNAIYEVIAFSCGRNQQTLNLLIPELIPYALSSRDRCCKRNIEGLRREIRQII